MARDTSSRIPSTKQIPVNLTIDKFNGGVVSLMDESLTPVNAVRTAKNLIQVQDGRWSQRWGSAYYGTDLGGTPVGAERFVASDGVSHIVVAVYIAGTGVVVKRSINDGETWSTCSGGTLTHNYRPYFLQINNFLYIANGNDTLLRYDGTTTLSTYTSVATPGTVTPTRGSGLSSGSFSNYYKVSAVNAIGETPCSACNITTDIARNNWKNDPTTADTEYISLAWSAVTGATRYNIYYSDETGKEVYIDSVTSVTYHDNGKASQNPYAVASTTNTTTGPKFGPMELSSNRIWGTKDPANQWRVYWSSTFPDFGAFSPYYDGGYVDLELGGAERPQRVIHYRDGKGNAFATVLTSDPEGNGSIWQIDLQVISLGNFSYTQPVPVKIVGSVGTIAPLSVVKVRDDIMFFNRNGFFSLLTKAQMLNLLSTSEISANIRPDVRSFQGSALESVSGYVYDAKVFYTVPTAGSNINNAIYVNDTERRNWAGPWTFGVERFFGYADNSGDKHLLAVPTSGTRLIEIGEGIPGDFGVPFQTQLITGLIPVNADRTAFAKIRKVYAEFSHPVGNINFTVFGTTKKGKYQTLKTIGTTGPTSSAGFDTIPFSEGFFTDTSIAPTAATTTLKRKSIRVNKLINAIQFKLETSDLNVAYTLLNFQAKGFIVPTRDPTSWRN